ncbi:branched-chain amino acid ABC transporter permease [Falsiroseomonas oryzae]|uniref:branched-chain amino acid ABC transporter permease n=1 Tax=Falsiroseomonas oryzae TaxID=2766473 RepID=UPI0022EA94B8|nr:branched-chain amino acid ABC transporter permease [Roseomonas sp. MO-31]
MEAYILAVLAMAGIYAMLAVSYDLAFGYAGLFSVAHGAFFGIGAYAGALSMLNLGLPFPLALLAGAAAAGLVAAAIALPASRLEGDYLIVGSLAFAVICHELMLNLTEVTRGPMGIPGIPPPSLFGFDFDTPWLQLLVILAVLAVIGLVAWRIAASPYGRVLRALKDDPTALEAAGKSVRRRKLEILTVSAAMAGAAGVTYASYVAFIDPESFIARTSFVIIVATVLGGAGTLWGPAIGALVIWCVPEALRFAGIPATLRGPLNEIVYAALLILIVMLRPEGIAGRRRLRTRTETGTTTTASTTTPAN